MTARSSTAIRVEISKARRYLADLEDEFLFALTNEMTAIKPPDSTAPEAVWMMPDEVAKRLRISERTVTRLISTGDLRCKKVGNQRRIHIDSLADYEARSR